MFNYYQFDKILHEVLIDFDPRMCTNSGIALLHGTCAVESDYGKYLFQINGPANGIFSIEPNTEKDIWVNYLAYNKSQRRKIEEFGIYGPDKFSMCTNIAYMIIMARICYWRIPYPLPNANDIQGLAAYWKKWYNTIKGKGTKEMFIKKIRKINMHMSEKTEEFFVSKLNSVIKK